MNANSKGRIDRGPAIFMYGLAATLLLIWTGSGFWLHGLNAVEAAELPDYVRYIALYGAVGLCWAAGWSVVTWIVDHESRFMQHLTVALAFLAIDQAALEMALPWAFFEMDWTWHPLAYWFLFTLALSAALALHLYILFQRWSSRLSMIWLGSTVALLSYQGLEALADAMDSAESLPYQYNIYPSVDRIDSSEAVEDAVGTLWKYSE